jgi:hypothetical protein
MIVVNSHTQIHSLVQLLTGTLILSQLRPTQALLRVVEHEDTQRNACCGLAVAFPNLASRSFSAPTFRENRRPCTPLTTQRHQVRPLAAPQHYIDKPAVHHEITHKDRFHSGNGCGYHHGNKTLRRASEYDSNCPT